MGVGLRRRRKDSDEFREIELGFAATESQGCTVVGSGSGLGGVESSKPDSGGLLRVANFGSPFSPWPLPHSSVSSSWVFFAGNCCRRSRPRSGGDGVT